VRAEWASALIRPLLHGTGYLLAAALHGLTRTWPGNSAGTEAVPACGQ